VYLSNGSLLLLLLVTCVPFSVRAERSASEASGAVSAEIGDQAYQADLPAGSMKGGIPQRKAGRIGRSRGQSAPAFNDKVSSPVSAISALLLWVLLICGAAVLLFWLVQAVRTRPRTAGTAPDLTLASLANGRVSAARRGWAGGADIRGLLIRSLGMLADRRRLRLVPAMTGREALYAASLGQEERRCLERLVQSVEIEAFGGIEVSTAEREECAASFQRLVSLLGSTPESGVGDNR